MKWNRTISSNYLCTFATIELEPNIGTRLMTSVPEITAVPDTLQRSLTLGYDNAHRIVQYPRQTVSQISDLPKNRWKFSTLAASIQLVMYVSVRRIAPRLRTRTTLPRYSSSEIQVKASFQKYSVVDHRSHNDISVQFLILSLFLKDERFPENDISSPFMHHRESSKLSFSSFRSKIFQQHQLQLLRFVVH